MKNGIKAIVIITAMLLIIPSIMISGWDYYVANYDWKKVSSGTERMIIKSEFTHGKSSVTTFSNQYGSTIFAEKPIGKNRPSFKTFKYENPYCLLVDYDLYQNMKEKGSFKKYYKIVEFNPMPMESC